MFSLQAFLGEERDRPILEWVTLFLPLLGISLLFLRRVPYGRYSNERSTAFLTACRVPARIAMFVQEFPAFAVPMYLILNVGGRYVGAFNPNIVLLGMFLLHYFHRSFIYSFMLKGNKYPIIASAAAVLFCLMNGFIQGRYLTHYIEYDTSWFYDPRFLVGHVIFLLGLAINIHSDAILRGLRKPGETGYKIPYGGMFEYVSGANYLGESMEWTGYAIACWSWPAAAFAIFTILFLGNRAFAHHGWYQEKFEDYPKHRKAFLPFIL